MPKMSTNITEQQVDKKGRELAKLAFSHHQAEANSVGEVLTWATKHSVHSNTVQDWFLDAGYPLAQARNYANGLRKVKQDPEVKKKVIEEEITFNQGVKEVREKVKENKHGWDMMMSALENYVRLAIKHDCDLEWMRETLDREYAKQNK
jgi:transcription initiation factor TFIIIB Brf1 subunit/transcription initiation factor TFIIB